MKCRVGDFNAHLTQHKLFQFLQKPFTTNPLHIVRRIDVDSHIGQMLDYITLDLQRLSVSVLSYLSWAKRAKPALYKYIVRGW